MIDYVGGNPAANHSPLGSLFKTISVLRIGAGVMLMTRHGWTAAVGAYQLLWKEQSWDWVKNFNDAGIPYPQFVAPAVALVVAVVALSWITGFLTRLFAVVLMPVLIGFLILSPQTGSIYTEAAWLYLFVSFTLLLFGSGAISLDKLFNFGESWSRRPKKRKGW
ncbi:MAG: DoxX family membrane protein [Verrucomicrobia bacterium]|nr:DoxX family membrane protein [Verrucomicrobiota bacterium]